MLLVFELNVKNPKFAEKKQKNITNVKGIL